MFNKNSAFKSFIIIGALSIFLWGCPPKNGPSTSNLQLKKIPVPSNVFSISGEVVAYEVLGASNDRGKIPLSLNSLRFQVGGFNQVLMYEYSREGKVLGKRKLKLDKNGSIRFKATGGNRVLIYADLGKRFENTYRVTCLLWRAYPDLGPKICPTIYCPAYPFPASELRSRIPEGGSLKGWPDIGTGVIGGFGGILPVPLCDQCFGGFIPFQPCEGPLLPERPNPSSEEIVYVNQPFPFDAPSGPMQIFKMKTDGSAPINLSNNDNYEYQPDVHHSTKKIVYVSSRPGDGRLYTMNIRGENVSLIPNTEAAGKPKWSRTNSFIFYVYPIVDFENNNSAIIRINSDGTGSAQITNPASNEWDLDVDVLDDDHIIFTRSNNLGGRNRDLYLKELMGSSASIRLTKTPDINETMPVVSHDGTKIAYRVTLGYGKGEEVHVAELVVSLPPAKKKYTLNVLHTIGLPLAPVSSVVSGIVFSADDTRLYISAIVLNTVGPAEGRQEIFSMDLDGASIARLTSNTDYDVYPSVVP